MEFNRNALADQLEAVAFVNLIFLLSIATVAMIGFAVGWSLTVWYLPAALLVTATSSVLFYRRRVVLTGLCVAVVIHLLAAWISIAIYDGSYDGLSYHQEAVIRLAQGWNPIKESVAVYGSHWRFLHLEHFPKAIWISGAEIFMAFGHIETGKLFHWTLMATSYCVVASMILRLTSWSWPTLITLSAICAGNPVSIYQSTTYLVDGIMASSLTLMIAGFILYFATARSSSLVVALLAFAIAVNAKFTGLGYGVVFLAFALAMVWCSQPRSSAFRVSMILVAAAFAAIFLLGYASYTKNLAETGHLVYPMSGPMAERFEKGRNENTPTNLIDKNRFLRFLYVQFSRTQSGEDPTLLKFPLSVTKQEMLAYRAYDVKTGGFGPLFGFLWILAVVAVILLLTFGRNSSYLIVWVWMIALLVSLFVHNGGWWARYAPQAWLLPILIASLALLSSRKFLRYFGYAILATCLINIGIVAGSYTYMQKSLTADVKRCLLQMSAAKQPVLVYLDKLQTWRQRLTEAGITFVIIDEAATPYSKPRHKIPGYGDLYWQEP